MTTLTLQFSRVLLFPGPLAQQGQPQMDADTIEVLFNIRPLQSERLLSIVTIPF